MIRVAPHAAPHAAEIASLRPRLALAQRARIDLARLTGCPDSVDANTSDSSHAELLAELDARWATSGGRSAGAHRAQLLLLAAPAEELQREVTALRDAQHEALHGPAWAELVETVRSLATEREAIGPDLRAADLRGRHLQACATALQQAALRLEAAPERTAAALAEATAHGLHEVLEQTGLLPLMTTDLLGADALRAAAATLDEVYMRLAPHISALQDRLMALERQLDELLG
jgi:hypothetical protein